MTFEIPPSNLMIAFQRIIANITRTQLLANDNIDKICGGSIVFKCENLQKTGSFKVRGALNAILQLESLVEARGVATHSSGNHAQALAFAAKLMGVSAYIVMPHNSPNVKIEGVKRSGGHITFCAPTLDARESVLKKVVSETGAIFIPPYDHDAIVSGQASVAMEVFNSLPHADNIIAPLGGGGLLSGTGLATRYFAPAVQVFGAEPATMDDGLRSFNSGTLQTNIPGNTTMAEGLRTHLSERTLHHIRRNTTDIITASEQSIVHAMQLIWENLKVIVEPSAAVPLAAILENKSRFRQKKTVVILSGGNVDLQSIPFLSGPAETKGK